MTTQTKLNTLVSDWGFSDENEMYESTIFDSVAPSICLNDGCDYSTEMEPDQDKGLCECCKTNTVASCLILGGLI